MKAGAYAELSWLYRTFKYWNLRTFKTLYCIFTRLKLEYCASIWNSYNTHDIEAIESVQKNATKHIWQIKSMHYEERLEAIGITTLANRRIRKLEETWFSSTKFKIISTVNWIYPIKSIHKYPMAQQVGHVAMHILLKCKSCETVNLVIGFFVTELHPCGMNYHLEL